MLVREIFDGPHVCTIEEHFLRIAEQDRREERDGGEFEVRSSRLSELRTQNFELRIAPFSHFTHFTRHGP
jgi:hypothetical protein